MEEGKEEVNGKGEEQAKMGEKEMANAYKNDEGTKERSGRKKEEKQRKKRKKQARHQYMKTQQKEKKRKRRNRNK